MFHVRDLPQRGRDALPRAEQPDPASASTRRTRRLLEVTVEAGQVDHTLPVPQRAEHPADHLVDYIWVCVPSLARVPKPQLHHLVAEAARRLQETPRDEAQMFSAVRNDDYSCAATSITRVHSA